MSAPEHFTTFQRTGLWGEGVPSCSCGWRGTTDYPTAAETQAEAHLAEVC